MAGGKSLALIKFAQVLFQGQLYGKVSSFSNGSVWEMLKDDGMLVREMRCSL